MPINALKQLFQTYRYHLCFLSIFAIYVLNLCIDVMEVDAAQYASIAREMTENGSVLEVYHRGADYLDKPPLLFWLSALSLKLLGLHNSAYKLPALLFLLLGIYATYRFARLWYNQERAVLAALILCCTQAFFLMTNDVRTDGILTGLVMLSVWQLSAFLIHGRYLNLFWGAVGVGAAMVTKGPIGLIVVASAIGGDLLLKRQWKAFFKPQWLLFVAVVSVLLLPMCYGLYTQFDLHPEKEVYGLKAPSGLKFFFWTQSFGRITGDIYWDNNTGFLYFIQTMVWDFQPWFFIFLPALALQLKQVVKDRFFASNKLEYITLCGFLFNFLALSSSHYKLPHYVFPLFPFAAILTANYLVYLTESHKKVFSTLSKIHFALLHLFFVVLVVNFCFFFPPQGWLLPLMLLLSFGLFQYTFYKNKNTLDALVLPSLVMSVAFGLVLSLNFYPSLLKYQSTSMVGKEISKRNKPSNNFYYYKQHGHSLDFYTNRIVPAAELAQMSTYKRGTLIFTNQEGMIELIETGKLPYHIVKTYWDYPVTHLKIPFLNKKTRLKELKKSYLLEKN